jgi:hypothetical protein
LLSARAGKGFADSGPASMKDDDVNPIRPTDLEPTAPELEALLDSEELQIAEKLEVPDEVKEELLEDVERRREHDREEGHGDEPLSGS